MDNTITNLILLAYLSTSLEIRIAFPKETRKPFVPLKGFYTKTIIFFKLVKMWNVIDKEIYEE